MTISELIAALQRHPSEMRVCVDGYEGGVDDVSVIAVVKIKLNVNEQWYYGDHEEVYYPDETPDETAIVIRR